MMADSPRPAGYVLPVIVFSQFAGGSLWFAGNAVLGDLTAEMALGPGALGWIISSVQLGFILGTLGFAVTGLADRLSPRVTFLACSLLGGGFTIAIALFADGLGALVAFRFLTGLCLAGIYPIGMKIAAGWYRKNLGNAIGWLVGALVLGTALPHLLKSAGGELPWRAVIYGVSACAAAGGILMALLVGDGPYLARSARFEGKAIRTIFSSRDFRSSAFGYFGHMWELYAFWVFVPAFVATAVSGDAAVSAWSFAIIGAGAAGCVAGGLLSRKWGSPRVAFLQLAVSGSCCLLSPLIFTLPAPLFLGVMIVWGVTVAGDSPQFSTLNARFAPREFVGSALTIVTCVGFSLTIASIEMVSALARSVPPEFLPLFLVPGPVLGLLSFFRLVRPAR